MFTDLEAIHNLEFERQSALEHLIPLQQGKAIHVNGKPDREATRAKIDELQVRLQGINDEIWVLRGPI